MKISKIKANRRLQYQAAKLPEDLVQFLTPLQLKVLKCYLANYTYQEIAIELGIGHRKKAKTLDILLEIGRALGLYHVLECELVLPKEQKSEDFIKGWVSCRKLIWRLIKNEESRWKTLKIRDNNSARES